MFSARRSLVLMLALALVSALALPRGSGEAQNPKKGDELRFRAVKAWTGTFTIELQASTKEDYTKSYKQFQGSMHYHAQGTVQLNERTGPTSYEGDGTAVVKINYESVADGTSNWSRGSGNAKLARKPFIPGVTISAEHYTIRLGDVRVPAEG